MKRFLAIVAALCLLILPVSASARQDAASYSLFDVRYYFEHRFLPQLFHESPETVMADIREYGPDVWWQAFTETVGFESPYAPDEFGLRDVTWGDTLDILIIEMPMPEQQPLSIRIYMCRDTATGEAWYAPIELDTYGGNTSYFLCVWTPDMKHYNYGQIDYGQFSPEQKDSYYDLMLRMETDCVVKKVVGGAAPSAGIDPATGEMLTP